MMLSRLTIFIFVLGAVLSNADAIAKDTRTKTAPAIDHVVVIVLDSLRTDFIDRFDMKNIKKLRAKSQNHVNAYLGYMGSETVVSHLVIPTGLLPKDLPWQDDIWRDTQGLLKKDKVGAFYSTGSLNADEMMALMRTLPKEKYLQYRLKQKFGGKIATIAEKTSAAYPFGSPYSDFIITMKKKDGRCSPDDSLKDGPKVPEYIAKNDRYNVDCKKKYGTEKSFYALDGARFVPGDDPARQGGDVWVADAAIEVMEKESWSGLFLSFGGIDKITHMNADHDGPRELEFKSEYGLPEITKVADEQIGRIISKLEEQGLSKRTLIVLTSDHGGQPNTSYLGNGKTAKWGLVENEQRKDSPNLIDQFGKVANVEFSYQDSAMRVWLKDNSIDKRKAAINAMSKLAGTTEIYELIEESGKWRYQRAFSALNAQPAAFQVWAKKRSQEIVDAMATRGAPDLIGLLADGVGYDLLGDHGGAQEKVQRVPLIVSIPGTPARKHVAPVKSSKIAEMIGNELKL